MSGDIGPLRLLEVHASRVGHLSCQKNHEQAYLLPEIGMLNVVLEFSS